MKSFFARTPDVVRSRKEVTDFSATLQEALQLRSGDMKEEGAEEDDDPSKDCDIDFASQIGSTNNILRIVG